MRGRSNIVCFIILIIFLFALWYVDHHLTAVSVFFSSNNRFIYVLFKDGHLWESQAGGVYWQKIR